MTRCSARYSACGYLNLAIGQFYVLGAILPFRLETWAGIYAPAPPMTEPCVGRQVTR